MLLALKLLFFLGVFCKFVSSLVASGIQCKHSFFSDPVSKSSNAPEIVIQAYRSTEICMLHGLHRKTERSCLTKLNAAVLPDTYPLETVDIMRKVYGPRRRWWGDLNAQQTRAFYHELLPISLQDEDYSVLTLEQRARRACMARHAARLYARERCSLPSRITATLYDGFRHLKLYGTWNAAGLTWEELWRKYEAQVRQENPNESEDFIRDAVSRRILEKSCCTNKIFDRLTGISEKELAQKEDQKFTSDIDEKLRLRRRVFSVGRRVIRQPMALFSRNPELENCFSQAPERT